MKYACMVILSVGLCSLATAQNQKAPSQPLKLVQTIPLPGVEGRIDHMNVDVQGKRLFMAALGNQSVEIVDLAAGKRLHSITELGGDPEGILYVPESNLLFVSAGTPGVNIYDGTSFKLIRSIPAPGNDNLRYDPQSAVDYGTGLVFVDGLFYDAAHKRLYMSGTDGMIGVFEQRAADHYALVAKIPSSMGAGTSLFVPELNRLYVAAPRSSGQTAKVLIHETQP